jgi:hypothetical protein
LNAEPSVHAGGALAAGRSADAVRFDRLLACLAGGLALALYAATLAPGVLGGDSGEYQVAAWLAGFVHPTGYPLFLIMGWLWTHLLPFKTPAWRLNLFTALTGGLAVAVVYLLALHVLASGLPATLSLTQRRALALFAAACFAVSPTFWSQAVIAESYPLHAAFVAAILLCLMVWIQRPACRPLIWLAALYGLSLTHHRTTLLLAPVALVILGATWPRTRTWRLPILTLALLLCTPLLLYLYIPLRTPGTPYVKITLSPAQTLVFYQPTVAGFLNFVSGRVFSPALLAPAQALGRLPDSAALLLHEFTWVGVALGMLGVLWLVLDRRWVLLALTALTYLAFLVFNLFYGIPNIWVYFIPDYLIWCLWMALGLGVCACNVVRPSLGDGLFAWSRAGRNMTMPMWLQFALSPRLWLVLGACALPAWLLVARYALIDQSHNEDLSGAWRRLLAAPLPQGAVLLSNDRDEMTPLLYYQYVDGLRPDLVGLYPSISPDPGWADIGQTVAQALLSQRPVFLIKPMPGLEVKYALAQTGPPVRVLGPATTRPAVQLAGAVFGNAVRLTGYDARPARLMPGGRLDVILYWQPLEHLPGDYTTSVQVVNASGTKVGQSDAPPGGLYYPTSLWQPGDILRDEHTLQLATIMGPPPYRLLVGLYRHAYGSPDLEHLGQPQEIAQFYQQ